MRKDEPQHLTPGEIMDAATKGALHSTSGTHLDRCEECRTRLTQWTEAVSVFTSLRRSVLEEPPYDCPTLAGIANYCAGNLNDDENSIILLHVQHCSKCAEVVKAVCEETCELLLPSGSAADGGIEAWAKTAGPSIHWSQILRFQNRFRIVAAVAAILAVTVATSLWFVWHLRSPEKLLADAYTQSRPFEYRLPDRGYSPVRQQRGPSSAFDRPHSLISAELALQKYSAGHPTDAQTLALKGRAELLELDYESAIPNLTRASELGATNVNTLVDLASAFALRGDVEQRAIDYSHALDILLRALKLEPNDQRALFNAAVVEERLWLVNEALAMWRKFLSLNPPKGWAIEARQHIDAAEKLRQRKKTAQDRVTKKPAEFLALTPSEADPELYQEIFWRQWLPETFRDPEASEAAIAEARLFAQRFGDRSLLDAIPARSQAEQGKAAEALERVLASNQLGNNDAAMTAAEHAVTKLDGSHMSVAAMRARLELAYSYNRAAKRNECLSVSEEVLSSTRRRSYVWLAAMAHLIHAACLEGLGDSGTARVEIEAAYKSLESRGLKRQSLLAFGLLAGIDGASGNYSALWDSAREGLARYWESDASPMRAQQFQHDMRMSAASLGWNYCALMFSQAAARSANEARNASIEMVNRVETAVLLGKIGELTEQKSELSRARKTAEILPGPSGEDLKWNLELEEAEAEVESSRVSDALARISTLQSTVSARRVREQIRFYETRGRALMATKNIVAAAQSFAQAIKCNRQRVGSETTYTDRLAQMELTRKSYVALTEIWSTATSDGRDALRLWHEYQNLPDAEASLSNPIVTYAILQKKIAVWVRDKAGVHLRIVDVPAEEVESSARRFVQLCASPLSNESELRLLGRRLFHLLIGPELKSARSRVVTLEADSWISSIPFEALTDDSGEYLANKWTISAATEVRLPITRRSTAMVITAPSAQISLGMRLSALTSALAEGNDVASRFANPILVGQDTGLQEILLLAETAQVFHFSGHGWSDGGNGALLLTTPLGVSSQFVTSRLLAHQHWNRSLLAVLSACLTAAGEQRGPVNNDSLVRAVLSAGARRVVAARWSIDSSATYDLMKFFYNGLFSGLGTSEALVQAERLVAATGLWSHPYYWAAFEVFGRS